jgi:hypothetical protein
MNRQPRLERNLCVKAYALAALLVVAGAPSLVFGQNDQVPRRVEPGDPEPAAQSIPRNIQLERRFLESRAEWVFYHRVADVPQTMREVLFKATSRSIVDTGKSFDIGDVLSYGSSHQHLFSASSGDLWVMVWYAGSFSGATLHALLYDDAVGDGYEYDFRSAIGAISLQPELKDLIRGRREGTILKYHRPGTL